MGKTPVWVGEERYNKLSLNGKDIGPIQVARLLKKRYSRMHYIDILGIRDGRVEWNLFQSIMENAPEVWADTGAIEADGIIDIIMSGADRPIISTKMISSLEEIASSFELSDRLIVQVDYNGKLVAKDGRIRRMSVREFAEEMLSLGIETFMLDDISVDRKRISSRLLEEFSQVVEDDGTIYAGVEEMDEIEDVAERGAAGAVISCSRLLEGLY